MSKKIVFIGSGSVTFTRNLVRDLLTFPAFKDAHIGLVDVDPAALEDSRVAVQRIIDEGKYPATIIARHGSPRGAARRERRSDHHPRGRRRQRIQ